MARSGKTSKAIDNAIRAINASSKTSAKLGRAVYKDASGRFVSERKFKSLTRSVKKFDKELDSGVKVAKKNVAALRKLGKLLSGSKQEKPRSKQPPKERNKSSVPKKSVPAKKQSSRSRQTAKPEQQGSKTRKRVKEFEQPATSKHRHSRAIPGTSFKITGSYTIQDLNVNNKRTFRGTVDDLLRSAEDIDKQLLRPGEVWALAIDGNRGWNLYPSLRSILGKIMEYDVYSNGGYKRGRKFDTLVNFTELFTVSVPGSDVQSSGHIRRAYQAEWKGIKLNERISKIKDEREIKKLKKQVAKQERTIKKLKKGNKK